MTYVQVQQHIASTVHADIPSTSAADVVRTVVHDEPEAQRDKAMLQLQADEG